MGRVARADRRGEATLYEIAPHAIDADELSLGDSIAVDGVCLTVTLKEPRRFQVLAGPETLSRTTLGQVRPGMMVNLERALRPSDRLGGHIVSGHVDSVGEICAKRTIGPALDIQIRAHRDVLRYVVEKGSIAIDGISLTVNRVDDYSFAVALIPHTLEKTTLGGKGHGAKVNLEVDIIGKYVEKLVKEQLAGRMGGAVP